MTMESTLHAHVETAFDRFSRVGLSRRRFLTGAAVAVLASQNVLAARSAYAQVTPLLEFVGGIALDCARQIAIKFFVDELTPTVTAFENWYQTDVLGQHKSVVSSTHNQLGSQAQYATPNGTSVYTYHPAQPSWYVGGGGSWTPTYHWALQYADGTNAHVPFFTPALYDTGNYSSSQLIWTMPILNAQDMLGLRNAVTAWTTAGMSTRYGVSAKNLFTPLVRATGADLFTPFTSDYAGWQIFATPAGVVKSMYTHNVGDVSFSTNRFVVQGAHTVRVETDSLAWQYTSDSAFLASM